MSDFRKVTDGFYASPQIQPDDIANAKALGITLIVNNRPEGEEPGQPDGAAIEAAAAEAGIGYLAIPITPGGFGPTEVEALQAALDANDGPILGFCRSGTRSTFLWSLAQAAAGRDPSEIAALAMGAGYDVTPLGPTIEALAARARG